MKKLIKCGTLFAAVDESVQKDVAILVEDNIIKGVFPASSAPADCDEVIDLSDKFVMPGMIDAHVHVTMHGDANAAAGMYVTPAGDLAFEGMDNARKNLMAGFTTVRDEGALFFADVSVKKAVNKGQIPGPRMLVSGVYIGSTGGHSDSNFNPQIQNSANGQICDSPDAARRAARFTFKYGADQIKLMGTGGVASMGDDPGSPEMTYEEMKAAIDIANSRGRLSSVHCHGADGMKAAIRAGITSIEHGMLMDDEAIDMMAEYGTYLVPTIIAAQHIVDYGVENGIPEETVQKAARVITNHYANLKKCKEKGVKICFGTDAGTPFNFHGQQTKEFTYMTRAGFTPAEALLAATRTNSELLRWQDKVGSIQEGKLADIIAFDKSPLEDVSETERCTFVMKDGVVYKG